VDWPALVRRYVWDEQRTPYLLRAGQLTRAQGRSELFAYGFFLALLASVATVVAALLPGPAGLTASPVMALYSMSILVGAIALGAGGYPAAARYCATAPVAMALAALTGILRPDMTGWEILAVVAVSALWLGYTVRIVRIARRLHPQD
jgi:hypothetical protein